MKVLHVINGLGTGGAEKLILDIIEPLVHRNVKMDLLLLNGEPTPFYIELEKKQIVKIFSLGFSFYNPFYILKLISYINKYDLIHVHLFPSQYFVVLAKILSRSKTPIVFTEHNTGNKRMDNPKFRNVERFIYSYYEKVICISEAVKHTLIEKIGIQRDKLDVIQNGINLHDITNSDIGNRGDFGFNSKDKLLIMVAGFREQKDQDTVIRTLLSLPPDYKLLLVGDGVRRMRLETLVSDSKLENRVKFLGIRSDVYSLIKMADISILSSHWEGFGLAAAEAMACGVPTIASNIPGLRNVVQGGGLLFDQGNVKDLYDKIISLENPAYYNEISLRGFEKSKMYDINIMVDKIINLYRSLCLK